MKTKRKPRTKSRDLDFDGAHQFGQELRLGSPASKKLSARLKQGLCLGCGKKPCECKSKWGGPSLPWPMNPCEI